MNRAALACVLLFCGIGVADTQSSKSDPRELGVYPISLSGSFNCTSFDGDRPTVGLKFDFAGTWTSSGLSDFGSQGKYTITRDRVVLRSTSSNKSTEFRMFRHDYLFFGVPQGSDIALTTNLDAHRNFADENILTCLSQRSKLAIIIDSATYSTAYSKPHFIKRRLTH